MNEMDESLNYNYGLFFCLRSWTKWLYFIRTLIESV
jgi:hypothetical protein